MVVPYIKHSLFTFVFTLMTSWVWTQQATVFSQVTINKNNVYVGEAVELTIGIYTSTFFTKGVDIGNIKVNGAFSVYFRSVSTVKKIKGKNYAGVEFIYNIFPFENQDIVIPSLNVTVETPNEGDYKGVKRTLRTKERILKIRSFPPGVDPSTWMVTNSMTVNEQWLGNTKEIKVGDVIERKITRRASGTLSELLPPIQWDSIPNMSLYPSSSELRTNKTKTAISAIRTDGVRYLFEAEGEVILPDMEFVWWSPYRKKFYKKTVKGLTVNVLPNPDLDMLKTAKAELSSTLQEGEEQTESEGFLILGYTLKQFLLRLIVACLILYVLIKIMSRIAKTLKRKYRAYKKSETYAFKKAMHAIDSKNKDLILPLVYKWIDQFQLPEPTLKAFAAVSGQQKLIEEVDRIESQLKNNNVNLSLNKKLWRKGRSAVLKTPSRKGVGQWINPR